MNSGNKLQDALMDTTISCTRKTITIECGSHDTKDTILDALTAQVEKNMSDVDELLKQARELKLPLETISPDDAVIVDSLVDAVTRLQTERDNYKDQWERAAKAAVRRQEAIDTQKFRICHCELTGEAHVLEMNNGGCELCTGGEVATPELVEKFFRAYEKRWQDVRNEK